MAHTELSRGRRWAVRGLLVVATLVTVVAIFAVWANRQVLDADNWADTSTELLENEAIRTQLSAFLVDSIYEQVDVAAEVEAALPERLDPLAGPAANGLRQLAERRTERLLERPRVQDAWSTANRVTMQQFIDIAEGDSRAVSLSGNAVVLNLREVMTDIVRRLGGSGRLVNKIPEDAGRITVMNADEVETLQNGVNAVQGLSAFLPGLAVALFALAAFLARGRRRRTIMFAGGGFILAGGIVLVGRNLGEDYIVDALASTASLEPVVQAAWSIGTAMLSDVAQAAIIMGIPVVIACVLAGPARAAVSFRRAAAPWLRARPDLAYGILAAGILLVIAWGPIPATRMILPVLLLIVLAFSGLAILRRQVAEEFPEATGTGLDLSLGAGVSRAAKAVAASVRGSDGKTAPATAAAAEASRLDALERLADLHERGKLSDEEFAAGKERLVPGGAPHA